MGTGSEPRQMPNLWKNVAGSVPVPFFHGALSVAARKSEKGTGTVGNANHHRHAGRRRSQSPFSGSRIYSLSEN